MTFDWIHFVNLAERLIEDRPNKGEALYRTVISRSYYGAHHMARQFLESHFTQQIDKTGDAHGQVIRALKSHRSDQQLYQSGRRLERLCDNRRLADYHEDAYIDKDFARVNIEQANDIVSTLRNWGVRSR